MPYLIDDDRNGIIELHPFSLDEIGGWNVFVGSFINDSDISFSVIGKKKSRLYEGTYHRFQQLYKGIPVEDGGFTLLVDSNDPQAYVGPPCTGCPVIDPCGNIISFSPHIYEGIDISTEPSIFDSSVDSELEGQIEEVQSKELKIVNNLNRNCEYRLVYEVKYTTINEGDMIGWVDAHTGETLYKTSRHNNKNAPTADFGTQFMNDQVNGNNTVLQNDRLAAFDMTGNGNRNFNNSDIPSSPSTRDWNCINQSTQCSDASTEVFQMFWMTDQVIEELETQLDIVFENVRVGYWPPLSNALSLAGGTPSQADFVFGEINGISTVEFDVVAHELGHAILRQFISSGQLEGGSLHEAISDMFGVYMESILDPNGLDWVMGDDMPFNIRDLQNTNRNCYANIQGLGPHARGEALGHWFFLCVNGDTANDIPPMSIDEVIALVYEALPTLGDNPDYPDLMEATMDLAESVYGTCSDQFLTILRSWEQICVPTGHRMANPEAACAVLNGNSTVCEENGYFIICLNPNTGYNTDFADWIILGKNSTTFESKRGMQGNSQHGGRCLEIFEIPEMPYYPQTITVKFRVKDSNGNYVQISKRVKILDCDGDDPTCEEYYNQNLVINNDQIEKVKPSSILRSKSIDSPPKSVKSNLIVFDLMGNRLDISEDDLNSRRIFDHPKIVILTYWNEKGKLIDSKKILLQ